MEAVEEEEEVGEPSQETGYTTMSSPMQTLLPALGSEESESEQSGEVEVKEIKDSHSFACGAYFQAAWLG